MDGNEVKEMEDIVIDMGKALARFGKDAFKHGVIAGVGATLVGIGIGHLIIYLPKAIRNRKKNETK